MSSTPPDKEFGTRRPQPVPAGAPTKRSGHVALLLMGTVAVGGGGYALMPGETCDPNRPALMASGGPGQAGAGCTPRQSSSSSGGHASSGSGSSSRTSFFSGDLSSNSSGASSSDPGSSHVTRGGFGSFAHSFASHFSGGG